MEVEEQPDRAAAVRKRVLVGIGMATALIVLVALVAAMSGPDAVNVRANGANTDKNDAASEATAAPPVEAVATTTVAPQSSSTTTAPPVSTSTSSPPSSVPPEPDAARTPGVPVGLWVVGQDGSNLHRVADSGLVSWSPDGRSLAVVARGEVRIVSAADGHVQTVIHSSDEYTLCLDWSAQDRLGWVTDAGTVWMAGRADTEGRVVDAGRLRTGNPSLLPPGQLCGWSPDGSLFAVGGEGVRMYSPDGKATEANADEAAVRVVDGLSWAPDGSALAAIEFLDGGGDRSRLVLLSASGPAAPRIPSPGGPVRRLSWRPDSSKLYVRTSPSVPSDPPGGIYVVDPETGQSELATAKCCFAALQPLSNSHFLSIATVEWGADTVIVADADGTQERVLMHADNPGGCAGSYFSSLRLSPGRDQVAVTATAKGGPRCDYQGPS